MAVYTEKWPISYALNTITELELTTTQNVQNNYTTVSYVVRVKKINNWNDHWTPSSGGSYTTLTIGGNNVLTNYRSNWTTNTGQASATAVVASGSTNVYHNADGTKTIDYKLTLNPNVSSISTMPNRVIEGSFQATTIPRASSFTLADTLTSGSDYTMTITRASTAFTHKVVRVIGGVEVAINNNASTSATINIPHSVFNSYPSSSSITATIIVRTFSGSTQIGSASKTVTVNLVSSAIPTVTGLSVSNSNSGPMTGNQFIRGISRLTLTASSDNGSYSSTISSYEFRYKRANETYQGEVSTTSKSYQYAPFAFPNSGSEVLAVAVRVKDSRGRYSAWKETASAIRVHYYQAPTIGSITVRRVGSNNTTLQVTRNYVVTSLLEGGATQKNTASLKFQTKVLGGANPTTFNTGATSTTMTLTNSNANLSGTFSASSSYEVRAVLSDAVNTVYGSWVTVGTEFVPLDFSSKGVGIGKIHSDGPRDLEVGSGGISSEGPLTGSGFNALNHTRYNDKSNYLGAGYISGGNEKPNWFGSGKLKPQMLHARNFSGAPGGWLDALWLSSYTGDDVKGSNVLLFDKSANRIGYARQNYDSTTWGKYVKIWDSDNDGADSGLDADLLDGLHASSFARSANLPSHGVSDGAQYSQYTKINNFYFSRGSASFTDVSQGVITFPVTYANPPYVLISIEAHHRYLNISAHIQTNSTKNATVVFGYNNGATNNFFHIIPGTIAIHWQAIGQVW